MKNIYEVIRYGFWGIISTGINLGLFYVFIYFRMNYLLSNVLSFVIAVIFSYYFNHYFVFKSKKNSHQSKVKFSLLRVISILVDSSLLYFVYEIIGIDLYIAKILVSALIIGSSYLVNRLWVFKA